MGKVLAICISEKKGTQKREVETAELKPDWGIVNDAHLLYGQGQASVGNCL